MTEPRFELPAEASRVASHRALDDWDELVGTSLDRAQASAEAWRNGLAGFVTILTSVLILKGPESAASMTLGWRISVGAMLLLGATVAIAALWQALSAASPRLTVSKSFDDVVSDWGSVAAYKVGRAGQILSRIESAKALMLCSLALLGAGYAVWWMAPEPTTVVAIETGTKDFCGELVSSGAGRLVLDSHGSHVTIDVVNIKSLSIASEC